MYRLSEQRIARGNMELVKLHNWTSVCGLWSFEKTLFRPPDYFVPIQSYAAWHIRRCFFGTSWGEECPSKIKP